MEFVTIWAWICFSCFLFDEMAKREGHLKRGSICNETIQSYLTNDFVWTALIRCYSYIRNEFIWGLSLGLVGDYAGWAANNTFHVGDTLLFVYNKAFHNVMEVKKADYNGCTAKSPISTQATGNDSIILKTEGDHYFLCGVPGHCQIGQKLMVKALAKGSSAAPSTAPAGAPASAPAPPSGGSGSAAGGSVSPAPSPKTSDATAASYKGLGLIVSAVAVAAGLVMS